MKEQITRQVDRCIQELRRNELTEESLRRIGELAAQLGEGRQDLLYLQAAQTSVTSQVIGMSMFVDGEFVDGPDDADDWPYQTVAEALADGWRIIKFPELALMMHDQLNYGLGYEFVLERRR